MSYHHSPSNLSECGGPGFFILMDQVGVITQLSFNAAFKTCLLLPFSTMILKPKLCSSDFDLLNILQLNLHSTLKLKLSYLK